MDFVMGTVKNLWTLVGEVVTTISNQPILLIPVAFFVAGGAIGLTKRLIGR